jgi:YD repeat-containing protein
VLARILCLALPLLALPTLQAQLATPTPDTLRVTVSMNADGTRTVYEFDATRHRATATTSTQSGKLVGRIKYLLDDEGRFASGEVYGPDDQFRFRTAYKYDPSGRLIQETQMGDDDSVRNKIVYAYDKVGKQVGYSVYDAAGKLIRQTPGLPPHPSPTSSKRR